MRTSQLLSLVCYNIIEVEGIAIRYAYSCSSLQCVIYTRTYIYYKCVGVYVLVCVCVFDIIRGIVDAVVAALITRRELL